MSIASFALSEPAVGEGPKRGPAPPRSERLRTVIARSDAVATPEPR